MLDAVRRLTMRVRALRFHLLLGVGAAGLLTVPTAALGRHSSHAASHAPAGTPSCKFSWYDPSSDAPGPNKAQTNQLDLVEGNFGLDKSDKMLRIVVNVKKLSKTIPAPADVMTYDVYWTNPTGDTGPNAVDATVSITGAVTLTDGTMTIQPGGGTLYTKNASVKGKFGSGPNGAIEWDVPLTALKLKLGQTLANPIGQAGWQAGNPGGPSAGNTSDKDPGKSYPLDSKSCLDTTS